MVDLFMMSNFKVVANFFHDGDLHMMMPCIMPFGNFAGTPFYYLLTSHVCHTFAYKESVGSWDVQNPFPKASVWYLSGKCGTYITPKYTIKIGGKIRYGHYQV